MDGETMTITLTVKEWYGVVIMLMWAAMIGVFSPQSGFFLLLVYAIFCFVLLMVKT
jgi:hypothetical protein